MAEKQLQGKEIARNVNLAPGRGRHADGTSAPPNGFMHQPAHAGVALSSEWSPIAWLRRCNRWLAPTRFRDS
jgi:hypothetical protein